MSVFAIADLHLSLGADKPMDIFHGWRGYMEKLELNWRKIVSEKDTVVVPGDLSWAMSLEGAVSDFKFLQNLPGKKIVIKGNHDYWWTTMSKMSVFLKEQGFSSISILHNNAYAVENICVCGTRGWFYDEGADDANKVLMREVGRLRTSILEGIRTGLEPVVFLHYPPVYGSYLCREIVMVLKECRIRRCFYGHLHGKAAENAVEGQYEGIRFELVSADHLQFAPAFVA